jgi:DNA-binding response OmpR family regulator
MSELAINTIQPGVQANVLLISDDSECVRIWSYALKGKNIESSISNSPQEALHMSLELPPDMTVIDIRSAEFDGINLVSRLREQAVVPILLLTPWNNETHILEAYQAGADECVVKPISPSLFLAKVKAWLRRTWSMPAESLDTLQVGGLRLDPSHRQVITENDETIKLTNLEFRLLHLLMTHPGWVLTTEDIVQKVWGYYGNGDSNLLKNVVYRLRRKIDPDSDNPRYIHTEAGLGYKFQDLQVLKSAA